MRPRQQQPIQLTFGPSAFAGPLPSADGKRIFAKRLQQHPELVRYDPESKQFVPFLGGIAATSVSFSRDGNWVAYVRLPDNHLFRSRVDGTGRLQLTSGDALAGLPRWSPDGTQIAYESSLPGEPWRMHLISADGGVSHALDPVSGGDPVWSSDGNKIAFSTTSSGSSHIGILDLRSGEVASLPADTALFSPRWSPDGRYLAALSSADGSKKLFLYDLLAKKKKWTVWLTDTNGFGWPCWTADSRYLQYETGDEVRRAQVGSDYPETMFTTTGLHQIIGPFWKWSGCTPDNTRMFTRDASGQDLYALDVDLP